MKKENVEAIIIGELTGSKLASHCAELATLANAFSKSVTCVLSGKAENFDLEDSKSELGNYGVSQLHCVDCGEGLSGNALAKYLKNLCDNLISSSKQVVVVAPATYLGRDVIAHLSAFQNVSVLANAVDGQLSEEGITTTHMVFGGSKVLKAELKNEQVALMILRPKSIAVNPSETSRDCKVVNANASDLLSENAKTKVIDRQIIQSEGPQLDEANIVVSGGRGLGSKENYEKLVAKCAEVIGGATGASRAIVDAGWVPYSKQVGQTGKTVKPDVYIACGISGATQHLVGMKGSKNIIAINTDEQAPIFDVADLGIVADVNVVLPQLIEKLEAIKNN